VHTDDTETARTNTDNNKKKLSVFVRAVSAQSVCNEMRSLLGEEPLRKRAEQ